jgi:hypothetical protein
VPKGLGKCHKIEWSNLHLVTIYWMMMNSLEPSMWWSIDIRCPSRRDHNVIYCHDPPCIIMSFTFAIITSSLPSPLVVRACKSNHCFYVRLKQFFSPFVSTFKIMFVAYLETTQNYGGSFVRWVLNIKTFHECSRWHFSEDKFKRSKDVTGLQTRSIKCIV